MSQSKMYAFWPYDQFPYVLCAAGEVNPDGKTMQLDGFGRHGVSAMFTYQPLVIGKVTSEQLKALEAKYRKESKELLLKYKERALEVLPALKMTNSYKDMKGQA